MTVGAYGSVLFEVSAARTAGIHELRRSHEWDHAEHEIIKGRSRLQYLGKRLESITVKGVLADTLVDDVRAELAALVDQADTGEPYPLVIGNESLGQFVAEKLEETWTVVDGLGRLKRAAFEVSLKEFG